MWILACMRMVISCAHIAFMRLLCRLCGLVDRRSVNLWGCGLVDLWTLWTCGLRAPVGSVDMWTPWTCGPVNLWTCGLCEAVDSVDLWTCGLCEPVDLWTCGLCGPVHSMDLWTLWTCGLCGPLYLRQRTDPRTQLLLSFLFCLVYCLLKLFL